jgi:hypothetical protein
MGENVNTSSTLTDVAELLQNEVPENEVPGTAVPENDVNSGSDTAVAQNEPEWFRNGDAWVKIFLEPIEQGKFKQHDYVYDVPGKNEFPKERWTSAECKDGFHITRRKDVWFHLPLHDYKSACIAEVVSMGDEFYYSPSQHKRKVRVVTFGPAVPLADVLGKHLDDFKKGHMVAWSVRNNHPESAKLAVSKNPEPYVYRWAFEIALKNENDQIAEFLIENCKNDAGRKEMLCNAIRYGRADFVKRLMENTPVRASFFKRACFHGQFEILELLCAKYGEPKCSDIIPFALDGGNVNVLKYLRSRGVDMSDFGMFVYVCTDYASNTNTLKYLVSAGADVKHPLIACIMRKYALRMEVYKYLLTQIDDKSEGPVCKGLDAEIVEIRNTFLERINAGEFDGE